jgi:hypothetical protein
MIHAVCVTVSGPYPLSDLGFEFVLDLWIDFHPLVIYGIMPQWSSVIVPQWPL